MGSDATRARAAGERDSLSPDSPWGQFVLGWADDEMLLAHQLGHLLSRYTEVEELIAIGSLAQDDLAHAVLLYGLLEPDPRERDRLFFERDLGEFRCSALIGHEVDGWEQVVARQYLYKSAEALRLREAADRAPTALQAAAHGMAAEEHLHRAHWEHWCEVLAASPEGAERLRRAVGVLWATTGDLFAPHQEATDLDWPAEGLFGEWRDGVAGFLGTLGLEAPAEAPTVPPNPRAGVTDPALAADLERSRRVYEQDANGVWG
jgi:phenylacetate-CoA oxygenase PaaI subunit